MSFQDVVGSPSSGAKNQSESAAAAAAALFQVNTAVAAFRRLVDAIGTSKDSPDHRLKLHNTRQRILELVTDASAKLKSLTESDIDSNRKVQNAKLAKDFRTTLEEFQKVQHLASERESRFSPTPPSHHTTSSSGQYAEPSSEMENESLLMEQKRQEVVLLDNDIAYNEAVIEEREQGIGDIQDQIREANEIFKDLAVLVYDQSVTIDDIDHNVERSAVSTIQSKLQLSKGSKTGQSKACWCWWVVAIVVIVVVIGLVIIII